MGNHIILEPAFKIREIARHSLANFWSKIFIGMMIYQLLAVYIPMILDEFFYYSYDIPVEGVADIAAGPIQIGFGGDIYDLLIGGPLALGFIMFMLTFFRAKKVEYTTIFDGFSYFMKAVVLTIFMGVRILLWSLLLVVPGIIASYRYSQAYYIMADHPEYTATQCIEESKRLMNGNKGRLFYLDLTFIGWSLLAGIPGGIFDGLFGATGFSYIAGTFLLSLPVFLLNVYIETSRVVFYELATERLVVVQPGTGYDPDHVVNAAYEVRDDEPGYPEE